MMDVFDLPLEPREQTIVRLRRFSRELVRELGFMRSTLAASDLAPSAVHAIIEIGEDPGMQASRLADILRLDKSNTSRQLAKLEALGLISRIPSSTDARSSALQLTEAGHALRKRIDRFATDQVSNALRHMAPADQEALARSLSLYASALAQDDERSGLPPTQTMSDQIVETYMPGCIGDVASLHARFYSGHAGFGVFFERKVASEFADFAQALPHEGKALWLYVDQGRTWASLVIDGDLSTREAHLRWFIVDDALRGTGMGRKLLERAMAYVDQRFDSTYLWTFKGLDAARHLYESFGFTLTEEAAGTQWGTTVTEQKFSRQRPLARAEETTVSA